MMLQNTITYLSAKINSAKLLNFKVLITIIFSLGLFKNNFQVYAADFHNKSDKQTTLLEPIIVTSADGFGSDLSRSSAEVALIDMNSTWAQRKTTLAELLDTQSGIEVFNSGGRGRFSSLFIRGASPSHTLVVIDGMLMNDAGSPTRTYDFSKLLTSDLSKVEIIKGPQSLIYGSDALGGVIYIETKTGTKKPSQKLSVEIGSQNTSKQSITFSGHVSENNKYYLALNNYTTEGISASRVVDENFDKDGHQQQDVLLNFQSQKGPNHFKIIALHTATNTDLDDGPGASREDPNHHEKAQQSGFHLNWDRVFLQKRLHLKSGINQTQLKRTTIDPANNQTEIEKISDFSGIIRQANITGKVTATPKLSIILGTTAKEEIVETSTTNKQQTSSFGLYTLLQKKQKNLTGSIGLREDNHSVDHSKTHTYRGSLNYNNSKNTIYTGVHFGTGFKSASVYQLYDQTYGNPLLKPEFAKSYDVNIKLSSENQKNSLTISYFHTHFRNLISSAPVTFKSINISSAEIAGVESQLVSTLKDNFRLTAQHTHLVKAEDLQQNSRLIRRPTNSWKFGIEHYLNDNWLVVVDHKIMGDRIDYDAESFVQKKMPEYSVTSLSVNYDWSSRFNGYIRIENIFDETYEEIDGYSTSPLGFYLGGHWEL